LHTPTGRKVLMQYASGQWNPIMSFGSMVVYVDPVNGTDSPDYGGTTGTGAFQTIQYAWNSIPAVFVGDVQIILASGTYSENLELFGKAAGGPYTITISGSLSTSVTEQTTTGVDDSNYTGVSPSWWDQADISVSSGGLLGSDNKLVEFTSGALSGQYRIADSSTSTNIVLVGKTTGLAVGDKFKVMNWATTIDGGSSIPVKVKGAQQNVVLQDIKFTASAYSAQIVEASGVEIKRCFCNGVVQVRSSSVVQITDTYLTRAAANALNPNTATVFLTRCKVEKTGSGTVGVQIDNSGTVQFMELTKITGYSASGNYGVLVQKNSTAAPASTAMMIHNCYVGVRAQTGGKTTNMTSPGVGYVSWSGNTTDTSVDSSTYGVIA